MTDLVRSGAALGFALGVGLMLVWLGLPRHRRPGLAGRVVPYLRDTPRPSRLLDDEARPVGGAVGAIAGPLVRDLGRGVERVMGGADSVRRRQLRAGLPADVDRFRAEQVLWGAAGAVVGGSLGTTLMLLRDGGVVTVVMMTLVGLGLGVTGADYLLSRRATRREARMLTEFPTVAELLALAVGAGEGAVGALDRVCRLSRGELAGELRRCLADARAGANLPTALQGLADRTGLPSLRRFVDGVVIAVQRGTPLAEVLRAQAQDVREEGRRALMEAGGRKEIAMMVPVVFLILPVTVLFAVFPGFTFFRFTL
ncbi:MAG TPA: type II secretion system F family protein [Ornithinibacter sp.]|nr:type II secretion system F family protein [Ornithinibacter sp.]